MSGQKSNPATPSLANEAKKAVFLRNNTIRDRLRLHNLYLHQHLINIIFMNFIYSFQYMHVYHFIKFWIGNFTSEIGFSKVCSLVPRIHTCRNNNLSNSWNKFHILRQTMKYHLFTNCDFLVVQFYKKWLFVYFNTFRTVIIIIFGNIRLFIHRLGWDFCFSFLIM